MFQRYNHFRREF